MQMNKFFMAFLVIAAIWVISFGISKIIETENNLENKIVILPIKGIIVSDDEITGIFGEENTVSSDVLERLDSIEKDGSIKSVVLEINSPGGTVVASKEIAERIKKLNKPVVAWIREYGASGAYWIASSSDYIVADELSVTGSIGVIGSYLEFSRLFEKYGVGYERMVAGDYKDAGTQYKKLAKNERELLQKKLDLIHKRFKDDVSVNRNISSEKMDDIANGIFYLGYEAYDLGLVDKLGNKEDAISKAKEIANIKEAKLVEVKEKKSFIELLSRIASKEFYYAGKGIGDALVQNGFGFSLT